MKQRKSICINIIIYSLTMLIKDEQTMLTPFDAILKMLTKQESNKMNLEKKLNLFFVDFEMMPLLAQENYLTPYNASMSVDDITKASLSSEYISIGDCITTVMRTNNSWELLPNVGLFSCVAPSSLSAGFIKYAKFPQWLGQNSSMRKTCRQTRELMSAMAGKISIPRESLIHDALPTILGEIILRIKMNIEDRIQEAINLMNYFNITINHFKENMMELCTKSIYVKQYNDLPPSNKANFTKIYNRAHADIKVKKKSN